MWECTCEGSDGCGDRGVTLMVRDWSIAVRGFDEGRDGYVDRGVAVEWRHLIVREWSHVDRG